MHIFRIFAKNRIMDKSSELNIEQKKDFAKIVYLNEPGITQKELAARVGVSKVTINKWINNEKWEELCTSLLVTKETQLKRLYAQLKALNDSINAREEGKRFPDTKEGNVLAQITAAINRLETETSTAEKMATGQEFLQYVRKVSTFDMSREVAKLFNEYIKSQLK